MSLRNKIKFAQLISTNLAHQTKEFFSNSTLHGIRYIAEKGRSVGEKLMWFCFVAIGAVAALVIIDSLWEKFQTNPTITGLDTDFHNNELDFPTISICPIDPFDAGNVNLTAFQTLGGYDSDYEDYVPLLEMLTKFSYENMEMAYEVVSNSSAKLDQESMKNLRQLAFKVSMLCDDLFYTCNFRGEKINCCEHFMPVYSERGFCYSFNSRYISRVEEEIKNDNILEFFETDKKWSLTFVLNHASKVYLQSTQEVFGNDIRPQFQWEPGYAIDLLISMKQTYTTKDAEQLTIGQRKCIFQGEVDLGFFEQDVYSLTSCMIQCRMEKANKLCKCIPPFYQPATGNYRKCTLSDFECLRDNRFKITDLKGCLNCELSCLNTVYESEKFIKGAHSSPKKEDSRVNIEFLTWPIIRYKREVLFGWVDLLVSFGGIAGLFLGFSLLSGIEVFYYYTLRASCMFVKNRQKLYEMKQEKEAQAKTRYDLSINPKFERLGAAYPQLSRSLPDIKTVKPVASLEGAIRTRENPDWYDGGIDRKRYPGNYVGEYKLIPRRQNIFSRIQLAPYSRKIKPVDENLKVRSYSGGPPEDVIFYGYLP